MKSLITIALLVLAPSLHAAEIYVGGNWTHISQADVGPPINNDPESSVDHLGVHAEVRWLAISTEWTLGASMGDNSNMTGCSVCWDDGGATFGTTIYLKAQWKVGEF